MRSVALAALVGLCGTGAASAQLPAFEQSLRASVELAALATPAEPRAATVEPIVQRRRARRDPGTVFLIVGGAVAVAGLLVDEGLLVVGGVVVAGYGLYLNVR